MGALPSSTWAPVVRTKKLGGGAVDIVRLPVAASTTIYRGNICNLDSNGKLVQFGNGTALTSGQAAQVPHNSGALFLAMNDIATGATVDESSVLEVMPLSNGNCMLIQAATFATTAGTWDSTHTATNLNDRQVELGYNIGVYNNAGTRQFGLSSGTSAPGLRVVEKAYGESAETDTFAYFWVTGIYETPAITTGTWTPAMTLATPGNLALSATTASGTWTKIGNRIIFSGSLATTPTHTTGSGELRITGLPLAAANALGGGVVTQLSGFATGTTIVSVNVQTVADASYLTLRLNTGHATNNTTAAFAAAQIVTTQATTLVFNGSYEAAVG